jgi:O-antigen ligase
MLSVGCLVGAQVLAGLPEAPLARAVAAVWIPWILSLLLSTEAAQLFDYSFHRRDGQLFFSIFPILALSTLRLDRNALERLWGLHWGLQALVAALGVVGDLLERRDALQGLCYAFDEGPPTLNFVGLYGAHNAAGSVLGFGTLFAAAVAVRGEGSRRRWFWGLLGLPLFWGVLLSRSRGALLALLAALAVLGLLAWRSGRIRPRALLGVLLAVALTAAVYGPSVGRRLGQLGDSQGTHTFRLQQWSRAAREWSWSPLLGIGMGRYNDEQRRFSGLQHVAYFATSGTVVNAPSHAHNSYLHFLAEGGLLGLAVSGGFWSWLAWRFRGSREPLRVAAFLGILYLFAVSFTEHYMGGGALLLVLSAAVGSAWSLPEPAEADKIGSS